MSDVTPHFITDDDVRVRNGVVTCADTIDHHPDGEFQLAWVKQANAKAAEDLISRETTGSDGRSPWQWVRLRDGTLMLACFPQGDTYMEFSDDGVCDWGDDAVALDADCAAGLHTWISEKGKLPANTKCAKCPETYGEPD